jgi:hypothetical protein
LAPEPQIQQRAKQPYVAIAAHVPTEAEFRKSPETPAPTGASSMSTGSPSASITTATFLKSGRTKARASPISATRGRRWSRT